MNFHNHCYCIGCINTDPGSTGGTGWTSRTTMTWEPAACASSYNVYRNSGGLFDLDRDGAADSYGSCLQSGLSGLEVSDTSSPPAGRSFFYAVSGKSLNGEGSLGYASNGVLRPNPEPCP
jgi:hypothetical protein